MIQRDQTRYLFIDQYGHTTILNDKKYKTIRQHFNAGRIQKMYIGRSTHIGFVVGQGYNREPLWLSVYKIKPLN